MGDSSRTATLLWGPLCLPPPPTDMHSEPWTPWGWGGQDRTPLPPLAFSGTCKRDAAGPGPPLHSQSI